MSPTPEGSQTKAEFQWTTARSSTRYECRFESTSARSASDSGFALVYGVPSAAGTYNFTITATDSNNCTGSRAYTVVIGAGALPASLPQATVGKDYNYRFLPALSTSTPIRLAMREGATPPGLSLSADNVLSGKPTEAGDFSFKLSVGEPGGPQQALDLKLHVEGAAAPTVSATISDPLKRAGHGVRA